MSDPSAEGCGFDLEMYIMKLCYLCHSLVPHVILEFVQETGRCIQLFD